MAHELPERYKTFDDLPNHIKAAIRRLAPGDLNDYVIKKMPAAGNRSIIDILNVGGADGEAYVLDLVYGSLHR